MRKEPRYRDAALHPLAEVLACVLERLGKPEQVQLVRLWQHWDMVMGPELASMAVPLEVRKTTLVVAADDNMVMQELSMMTDEILERVNAFMGYVFFTAVKCSLLMGKRALNHVAQSAAAAVTAPPPTARAVLSGEYLSSMRADSPVARCYAKFVAASKAAQKDI